MARVHCIGGLIVAFCLGTSSAGAQDFLKQLEEKLSQKRQEDAALSSDSAKPSTDGFGQPADESKLMLPPPRKDSPSSDPSEEELPLPKSNAAEPKKDSTLKGARSKLPNSQASGKGTPAPNGTKVKNLVTVAPNVPIPPTPSPSMLKPRNNGANGLAEAPAVAGGGGFLGMTVETIPGGGFGLVVDEIVPNSPAWKAGFRNGDRVIAVAGRAVSTVDAFAEQLSKYAPGLPVKFLVERGGRNANLIAVLQERSVAGQIHGNLAGTTLGDARVGITNPTGGMGYFGINVADMSDAFRRQFGIPVYRGASVTEVIHGSPAESTGLHPGDCIVEMNGNVIQTSNDVLDFISRAAPGQAVTISFYRGRQLMSGAATIGSTIASAPNYTPIGTGGITPEMLTPDYVASLQSELERVQRELSDTQSVIESLEARLQALERK